METMLFYLTTDHADLNRHRLDIADLVIFKMLRNVLCYNYYFYWADYEQRYAIYTMSRKLSLLKPISSKQGKIANMNK